MIDACSIEIILLLKQLIYLQAMNNIKLYVMYLVPFI